MFVELTRLTRIKGNGQPEEIRTNVIKIATRLTLPQLQEQGKQIPLVSDFTLLPDGYRIIFNDVLMGDELISSVDVVRLKES